MGWRQVALGRDMGENQHPPTCPVINVEYRHSVPLFNVIYLQGQGAIVIKPSARRAIIVYGGVSKKSKKKAIK